MHLFHLQIASLIIETFSPPIRYRRVNFAPFRAIRHKFAPFCAVISEHVIKNPINTRRVQTGTEFATGVL